MPDVSLPNQGSTTSPNPPPSQGLADGEARNYEWTDEDWERLIVKIKGQRCTPFLGAGACYPTLPLGGDIAREWAATYGYPFADSSNLVRVAQFVAIEKRDRDRPKMLIRDRLAGLGPPDFTQPDEIHRLVADLNLPVYITTNYDDFMFRALAREEPRRVPQKEVCKWHDIRRGPTSRQEWIAPTPDRPLVFHLHGTLEKISSMVLTEDDYLDFLITLSENLDLLPPKLEESFTDSSLLFLGYSLEDWNFRVIFRKLANYYTYGGQNVPHFSVQLKPKASNQVPTPQEVKLAHKQLSYLHQQYGSSSVNVFWGDCREFARELRRRL